MAKREVQEVNAGSMADIAFLLLIFFLVATTMNVDSGIQRQLPPLADDQQVQDTEINERNIQQVAISMYNQVAINGQLVQVYELKDRAKEFILNVNDDPTMPEKEETQIEMIGTYPVSKGVISLRADRGTNYETYIQTQNELTRAFNEIRDELSMMKFGKKFTDLSEAQREAVQTAVPLKISEAEPRNIGGN